MIDCVYYNDKIRCYKNGFVERYYKKKWNLIENKPKDGYLMMSIDSKSIYIHRLIAFCFLGLAKIDGKDRKIVIDHLNHKCDDNNINNLKVTTQQKNCENRTCKGYYKSGNKWRAGIFVNKKAVNLGSYNTEEEAKNVYLQAKEKYHFNK